MAKVLHNSIQRVALIFAMLCIGIAPASATPARAGLSGHVSDSTGKPQLGVVVELFSSASAKPITLYTDTKGFYSVADLLPGTYFIKASAESFLPSIRENVSLQSGSHMMINLTLNTLIEAFQLLPAARRSVKDDDDWRWTLRSAANRPILRVLDNDNSLVVVSRSDKSDDRVLKARVAFIAGSDGQNFSGSDMKTAFTVEQSLFSSGTMAFGGNLGYNNGQANGVVRASYKQQSGMGTHPEFAFTARRFASPDTAFRHAALSALSLSGSDGFTVADFLDLNYGAELQAIQFRGRVTAFRPFGSVGAHLSPNTLVEYRYATSAPNTRLEKGFDSAPADLSETDPRVSLKNDSPEIERARHQEIAVSQRMGKNNFQVAYFSDRVHRLALNGVGQDSDALIGSLSSANILPDVYSGTFTYTGGDLKTEGFRVLAQRKFSEALTATFNYSYGGVMLAESDGIALDAAQSAIQRRKQQAVTSKFSGRIPGPKTQWIASYKWTSGTGVLTPVDMFNASAGRSDPYFNIFIRQPIPGTSFLPGKIEALVDVRNLLSQGYVPFIGQDGHTLYLVQSARAIRGGLAFNF